MPGPTAVIATASLSSSRRVLSHSLIWQALSGTTAPTASPTPPGNSHMFSQLPPPSSFSLSLQNFFL
ncbi:hypothetical protein D3C83_195390 [compost metagenome]